MKTLNKSLIISGYAGIGKTFLANKYKNVIDLESGPYVYDYSNYNKNNFEKLKGNKDRIKNKLYPQNYIDEIKEAEKSYDIICVRFDCDNIPNIFDIYNIDYVIFYPSKNAYLSYIKKFKERGNSKEWIKENKNLFFNKVYDLCKNSKRKTVLINKNENLETKLIKMGFNLILKDDYT